MKISTNYNVELEQTCKELPDGRRIFEVSIGNIWQKERELVIIAEWEFPILDVAGRWHPNCRYDRTLKADWSHGEVSMSTISAPMITFFSVDGKNAATIAVSETQKKVRMNLGVHEEDGTMNCRIYIYAGGIEKDSYHVSILVDYRKVRYEQAIREVGKWWEMECGLAPAFVPEAAKEPMYSFWYSYHQEFSGQEIEKECKRARELGFGTVIVDDGWQTDDTNRGYGYCGDWKVAEKKICDMKKHVDSIHNLGMKYLLWFSVPYIGMYSEMWKLFGNQIIGIDEEQKTGILDIRYPEIREYLKKIYVDAVEKWGIDGLKLDFIDEFYEREETPAFNEKMDCVSLQTALDKLLRETVNELRQINKDILIEFRQRYIGPFVKQYGNMLRVCDCPESGLANRVGTIDLRLMNEKTAVHSDPVMWNSGEEPETAALQIIDVLFSTLQFSVKTEHLTEQHRRMLRNYMNFMTKYKKLLQESPITAEEPQNLYPKVSVSNEEVEIIVLYSTDRVVRIGTKQLHTIIVNGTKAKEIYICSNEEQEAEISEIDCYGNVLKKERRSLFSPTLVNCTTAGRIEIKKVK